MEYNVNTEKLKKIQSSIMQEQHKLALKTNVFYAGAFETSGNLSSALLKIKNTYANIPKTLLNIHEYLDEYINDIEAYESAMSGNGGSVKCSSAAYLVRNNELYSKNKLFDYEMDSAKLFQIRTYEPPKNTASSNGNNSVTNGSSAGSDGNSNANNNQSQLPNFDFNLPSFDLGMFDFNFDAIGSFDMDFSLGNIMNSMKFDLSSLGNLTLSSIGAIGLGNLGSINLGNLDLSNLGSLDIGNLDLATDLILKDIFNINGIDISGITNLEQLSTIDLNGLDLSNLTLNADVLKMLQNQIRLGNISDIDAINALHQLFPETVSMNLKEIMNLYKVDTNFSSSFSTGAMKGLGVSSALMLGFGALSGFGKSFGSSKSSSKSDVSTAENTSALSNEEHKNSFAGLSHAIQSGGLFGVTQDLNFANSFVDISDEVKQKHDESQEFNPFWAILAIDYETLIQNVFYRLKKFNQTKKVSTYLELINDANAMRLKNSFSALEERISFLIPSILPFSIKARYLYFELYEQSVMEKNISSYQHLNAVINNVTYERFKWVDLKDIRDSSLCSFESQLNVIDQAVNCGNVCHSTSFKNVFGYIEDGILEIVNTCEQIYQVEVPKVFHSDIVINEHSSLYDILLEKLESLSVQAILNHLSFDDSKKYLINVLKNLDLQDQNLYCFQDMERISTTGSVETIHMVRIGSSIYPYRYYACYEGVGLREINSKDVMLLRKSGFHLKEE